MIKLKDEELDAVFRAAQPLRVEDRDAFLQAVADEIQRYNGDIGPGAVFKICRETQRRFFDPPSFATGAGNSNWAKYR
jgi:hypothetical protein